MTSSYIDSLTISLLNNTTEKDIETAFSSRVQLCANPKIISQSVQINTSLIEKNKLDLISCKCCNLNCNICISYLDLLVELSLEKV